MSVTTVTISLTSRRDYIERFQKKNMKHELARKLAQVAELADDETLSADELRDRLQKLISDAVWGV